MPSIKRNFFYNILLNVSSVLFPLVTAPYVARVLNPDGVGLAAFASTYASYFALFASLGIAYYGVREVARRRDDNASRQRLLSELMSITAINTVVLAAVFAVSLMLFGKFRDDMTIFIIAGFTILAVPFNIGWYFSGMERFGFITARTLVIRVITIACVFVFVRTRADLYIYMILMAASTFGGIVWNFVMLRRDGIHPRFTMHGLKPHYKPLTILFASSVAISVYTMLDSLMLGIMADYTQVGYYNSASNISKSLVAVVTSLSAVAIPRMAYYVKQKDFKAVNDLVSKSTGVISFMAIPMTVGLICVAGDFVPLFFGVRFAGAVTPLVIMSVLVIAIGLSNLTGLQILVGLGEDKSFLFCMLAGTVSNFMFNILLIPEMGASGAAVSSVIAEFLVLAATIYYVRRRTPVKIFNNRSDLYKSLVATIPFIPITVALNACLSGWYFIAADMACCTASYLIMQYLLHSDSLRLLIGSHRHTDNKA